MTTENSYSHSMFSHSSESFTLLVKKGGEKLEDTNAVLQLFRFIHTIPIYASSSVTVQIIFDDLLVVTRQSTFKE